MKKLLFVCVAFAASLLFTNTASAQAVKIGYFDEETILYALPEYGKVDTLLNIYRTDSIGADYQFRYAEYQRADSAYRKDSATMPASLRGVREKELLEKRYYLVNWQQISQEMMQNKMNQLLAPLRQKIAVALKAIVAENKYTLVMNESALIPDFYVQKPLADNLTLRVALRLKIPVPKELEDAFKAATGGGGAAKPAGAKTN